MNHAIKIENLDMSIDTADKYLEVIQDFLSQLSFSDERINAFESRGRDGFMPYSHNCGGMEAISYRDLYTCQAEGTGFENTDKVLNKYREQDIQSWLEDKTPDYIMIDSDYESLDDTFRDSEDTVQFQARIMMTSDTTANVDFYVSASDTPYHRNSDNKLEMEITFKSPAGMKRQLAKLLKNDFVRTLISNIGECY